MSFSINHISKFISQVQLIGSKPEFNEVQVANNKLLNQIQLIVVTMILFLLLRDLGDAEVDILILVFVEIVFISFFFWRNKISYNAAARTQMMFLLSAASGFYFLYGKALHPEGLFIVCILIGTILLPNWKERGFYFLLIVFCFFSITLYHQTNPPLFGELIGPDVKYTLFLFTLIVTFTLAAIYLHTIKNLLSKKIELVDTLKIKNNELERFAYTTSHDLKEPLRNIGSYSGLLKRILHKEDQSEKKERFLTEIESAAKNMSALIEEILKYSKIEKEELKQEIVPLDNILANFLSTHTDLIRSKNVTIVAKHLPSIKGNFIYLSLLFQNLLENSIKYNDSKNPLITIEGFRNGSSTTLTFADNGIGIDKNFQGDIFEPFKRLHSRNQYEGTGLGLSICKKIVETHQGKIWVESSKGAGSKFFVQFDN